VPDYRHLARFRWAVEHLERGEPIHVSSPDSLPAEARREAESMRDAGVVSALTLPIRQSDRTRGFLILQRLQPRTDWTPTDLQMLQLAADLLVNAVERSVAERALADQLSIEQRIAALSQRVLELSADRIEEGIRASLDLVLELSEADRAFLVAIEPRPPFIQQVWEAVREGVDRITDRIGPGTGRLFHWTTENIRAGRIVKIADPDELPPEASLEREDLHARNVRSVLGIPVHADGLLVGCLTVEFEREHRRWSDAEVTRIRLVGDLLASARRRQRAESELARQLSAEQTLAALSRRFMALDPGAIEEAVVDGLREAARLARSERAILLFLDRVNGTSETYEWRAPGVPAAPQPTSARRWAVERILRGETLRLADVTLLPDEAAELREVLAERGVKSLLGLPVLFGEDLVGYIGFEAMAGQRWWSEQEITLLRLVGELLTGALQRHVTEVALVESQAQLVQSQKMEAVGRLAGGIAHDFNNLLTVILGFSRALMGELAADHWAREDVAEIHDAAERAAGLTRQLLTFSRQQRAEAEAVELGGLVQNLEQMLRRLLGEDVELRTELAAGEFWVRADSHQIEQVLINLAVNARDAMPDGGTLCIALAHRSVDEAERRRHGLTRSGDHLALSVSDTGVGLDEGMSEHIFEPFFTTKDPGKGTGLGLSIVYSVVEQCGGAVSAHGESGKGTTFEILLPVCEARSGAPAPSEPGEDSRGTGTVLLVEDEDAVRKLARRILERGGYRVIEAADGEEALGVARSEEGPIDLLVTDVVMPRLGGRELARQLREERPETRVLFVSGYPQDRSEGTVQAPEGGRFLYKPFTAGSLLQEAHACLTKSDADGPS
jgi:signal transduction histidine kinase